jgi:N-methylhydantoinase B
MGALAKAIPERVTGDIKGTANHVHISGLHPQSRGPFIFYEYPAGGTGAFQEEDGNNAVRSFTEGDFGSIQPVESIENLFPLVVERCELRADSAGDGRTRGGLGLIREVRVMTEEASLSILSDKNLIPPFGVLGGFWGTANRFHVLREGKTVAPSAIPGKVAHFPLMKGDLVCMETSGGGGYGDPLERDPCKIEKDLCEGFITEERAKARCGVAFINGRIDETETVRQRERLRMERNFLEVFLWNGEECDRSRRLCWVGDDVLKGLGLKERDLVELANPMGAPLRAWVRRFEGGKRGSVYLGQVSMEILGIEERDRIELRKVEV